ncbi:MAG: DNA translocase FtsK [Pseudobdellovibrionaceae bacterium]
MAALFKKLRTDILGITFFAIALFLGLALFSYNPSDPSLNSLGQHWKAVNFCGIAGSFLADLLYQSLGLASWLLIVGLLRSSWIYLSGDTPFANKSNIIWGFLFMLIVSSLLAVYFPQKKMFMGQIWMGGAAGLMLAQTLVLLFNKTGLQVILWSLLTMSILFYSENTLNEVLKFPKKIFLYLSDLVGVKYKQWLKDRSQKKYQGADISSVDSKETKKSFLPLEMIEDRPKAESNTISKAEVAEDDTRDEMNDEDRSVKRKVILKARVPRRIEQWSMPKISLLEDPPATRIRIDRAEIQRKADLLTEKLRKFSIEGEIVGAKPGPLVTMYEFRPNADVKISKISELEDDLSLALSSESVRVVGHIPGTDVVGIETSNLKRETVYYKDLVAADVFWADDVTLPMGIGRQVDGTAKVVDLRKMPHLLIAGTTGSGKSVFVSSIITGLLFRHSPKTLRLVLIDPKMVDLAPFASVPHLILPHVTEPKKATATLRWAVREMEKRYRSLSQFGVGKIEVFNEKVEKLTTEELQQHETDHNDEYYYTSLPYIVIVIDELADLMCMEKQSIEEPIQRLTQKARACGMHLIIATQSPRKDVVTGLIKTNIPGRVALKVASKMDSRIIIDDSGAERLLPNGDMLFQSPGIGKPTRHHGPYLSDQEIAKVVQFWSNQAEPEYDMAGMKILEGPGDLTGGSDSTYDDQEHDERYDEILAWAATQKDISASLIQRKFRLGYPRAARMVEIFEREGVVGPANGSKPRQVLVSNFKELGN